MRKLDELISLATSCSDSSISTHVLCLFLPHQRRKHSSPVEADDRESLQGPPWLRCRLLACPLLLQYGQAPQTELLIAFHLRTPTHPLSE